MSLISRCVIVCIHGCVFQLKENSGVRSFEYLFFVFFLVLVLVLKSVKRIQNIEMQSFFYNLYKKSKNGKMWFPPPKENADLRLIRICIHSCILSKNINYILQYLSNSLFSDSHLKNSIFGGYLNDIQVLNQPTNSP